VSEVTRKFTCLLCEAGPEQFKDESLAAIKIHLQKHLDCDAATREDMVKRSKGKCIDSFFACAANRKNSFMGETFIYTLPDPDGRKWLQEDRRS
jgi:hypothetical protein